MIQKTKTVLPLYTHTYVCLSGGKEVPVFLGKSKEPNN